MPTHNKEPRFYNKDGSLTRYSFACGYVETKKDLRLHMEHGVYHVRGFRKAKLEGDAEEHLYHIMGSFDHVKEARKFMSHPFTHKPSRNGSVTIKKAGVS